MILAVLAQPATVQLATPPAATSGEALSTTHSQPVIGAPFTCTGAQTVGVVPFIETLAACEPEVL